MTDKAQPNEVMQNEIDPWKDESQLVTSTFRMPEKHLKILEEQLKEITEFFEEINDCEIPRDTAIGHLIICGSNETIKTMALIEARKKLNAVFEKLSPALSEEFGISIEDLLSRKVN